MWLWRGAQSAIFYYVSLSPCVEYNHKRKRRKEAHRSQKERAELEILQPGLIHQPVPFQTNPYWAEEIKAGPGPPRGWRKHSLHEGAKNEGNGKKRKRGKDPRRSVFLPECQGTANQLSPATTSSLDTAPPEVENQSAGPSLRLSSQAAGSTLDALKDTIKSTIPRPDTWNWKRYEREDETLFGINDRISRMWGRATHPGRQNSAEGGPPLTGGRKRAGTNETEEPSWLYGRNPDINDLHPPTVSQLPRTRREVAWMMQPPPSRAVMEGKVRPGAESTHRRPLCQIGGVLVHPKSSDARKEGQANDRHSATHKKRPPDVTISPSRADHEDNNYTENSDNEEVTETDTPSSPSYYGDNYYYLSSRSSSLFFPSSSPSPPEAHSSSSPHSPPTPPPLLSSHHSSIPLRRPPLAVLVDPSATKFQSYHLPLPLPAKLAVAAAGGGGAARSMSFTPRPPLHDQHQRQQEMDVDVDVLMGAAAVLVPTFPARERLGQCGPRYGRYSLPDVRLGGGGY